MDRVHTTNPIPQEERQAKAKRQAESMMRKMTIDAGLQKLKQVCRVMKRSLLSFYPNFLQAEAEAESDAAAAAQVEGIKEKIEELKKQEDDFQKKEAV